MKQMYSLQEAGRLIGVSDQYLRKKIRTGELHAVRLGRSWRVSVIALANCFGIPEQEIESKDEVRHVVSHPIP